MRFNDLVELLEWLVSRRDWPNVSVVLHELRKELERI